MTKIFALLIFLSTATAQAEIYIEPYLGYSTGSGNGSSTETGSPPITTQGSNTSSQLLYGARAGYGAKAFAVGAEYETGNLSFKNNDNMDDGSTTWSEDSTYETKLVAMGVFGMFRYGNFNFYATYFPSVRLGEDRKGTGSKIGVGYTAYKSVYVNFEMMGVQSTEIDAAPENFTNYTFAHNIMMLSASFPLAL